VTFGRQTTDGRMTAILALTAAGALWGLTVPLSKLGLDWLGAGWLAFARFALAAPLLALVVRRRLREALTPAVVAVGAAGYGGVILLQNAGIERTSVSHAALIVGAVPVLVAVFAAAAARAPTWRASDGRASHGRASAGRTSAGRAPAGLGAWVGSLVALAGVGLVAGAGGAGTSIVGDVLVLLSVTGSAAFIVLQPSLLAGRDAAAVTAVQLGAGALVALPVALAVEGAPPAPAAAGPVVAVLALALLGTLLAFWLFAWAQARVPAELAGAFVNLEPLVGALTGAVAFHDAFGPLQAAGGVAILIGIALGALPRPPRRLPLDRPAVAEEAAGRPAVPQGGRPHDAGRAVGHGAAAGASHVRRHPTRTHGVHEHAVRAQRVCEHERERVQGRLGD
jgi:O-acetylserine/cysteine efflux transporter